MNAAALVLSLILGIHFNNGLISADSPVAIKDDDVDGSGEEDNTVVEEVHHGCSEAIKQCQMDHTQLAYKGLPEKVLSPEEVKEQCNERQFTECLKGIVTGTCSKTQTLDITGTIMAEDYICSEKGLEQYEKGNEYVADPWRSLKAWYMKDENLMCEEHFYEPTEEYFQKSEDYVRKAEQLPEPKNATEEERLKEKAKEEEHHYCNYMYSYQTCIERAAMRHANETIAEWQYQVVSIYHTPHFEYMDCHIGKGMKQITINAIIIVTLILCGIFGLALFCGVYEKCGERLTACRRSKSLEDLSPDKMRESVMFPDKSGMPQRTGSRVRFEDAV